MSIPMDTGGARLSGEGLGTVKPTANFGVSA